MRPRGGGGAPAGPGPPGGAPAPRGRARVPRGGWVSGPALARPGAGVEAHAGTRPQGVATSARGAGSLTVPRVRKWLEREPVLLALGVGHGLAPEVLERADGVLRPLRPLGEYNHLPVRAAAAILLDRLLGDAG